MGMDEKPRVDIVLILKGTIVPVGDAKCDNEALNK